MTAPDPSALQDQELAVLAVLVDMILPADENGPGALEAQVPRYIVTALAGELASLMPTYRANLRRVDQRAQDCYSGRLADALPPVQQAVMSDLAEDRIPGAGGFFAMLRTHVIEGFLGDPAWGGNADLIGWHTIGYPGPRQVVGVDEQRLGYQPRPALRSAYDLLGPTR